MLLWITQKSEFEPASSLSKSKFSMPSPTSTSESPEFGWEPDSRSCLSPAKSKPNQKSDAFFNTSDSKMPACSSQPPVSGLLVEIAAVTSVSVVFSGMQIILDIFSAAIRSNLYPLAKKSAAKTYLFDLIMSSKCEPSDGKLSMYISGRSSSLAVLNASASFIMLLLLMLSFFAA